MLPCRGNTAASLLDWHGVTAQNKKCKNSISITWWLFSYYIGWASDSTIGRTVFVWRIMELGLGLDFELNGPNYNFQFIFAILECITSGFASTYIFKQYIYINMSFFHTRCVANGEVGPPDQRPFHSVRCTHYYHVRVEAHPKPRGSWKPIILHTMYLDRVRPCPKAWWIIFPQLFFGAAIAMLWFPIPFVEQRTCRLQLHHVAFFSK